ncbi:hypothetical protein PsYK624_055600 [Phanerochaete sordida]|uniref:Uncharacterized protein n=1 Tax=Phanerochaete sordida TaxID=48140 RepID=A0A9P3G7W9_9APHY|nr:hypothetical protein PsYK624_055600 [Phanerochaete sordida]
MQVTEDPDGGEAVDLYKEHMVVVDGWNAYETPASPAASIHFPLSQEEDELAVNKYLLWSSPAADEGRNRFNFEKMDEHELPRSQRIRGSHGQPKSDGQDESLQEMLSFLRPIPKTPQKRAGEPQVVDSHLAVEVKTPRSEPSSPHTTITASLLGQPPTALYSDLDIGSPRSQDLSSDDVGITRLLKKMYKNETGAESGLVVNPQDFILKERLDEKETHLMDVPDLLPPNEHAPSIAYMPTTLRALLAPKQERVSGNAVNSARPLPADYASDCVQDGFLKEIKGFKALFLGLSWRPFDFGPSIPTHEELSRVVDSVQIDCLQDVKTGLNNDDSNAAEDALARLLDDLTVSDNPAAGISQDSSAIPSTQCWLLDQPSLDALATADDPEGFLLTTSERRRLLGLPEQPTTSYSDHGSEDDFVEDRPVKRLRFSSPVEIIEITPRPSFEREPDYHEDAAGDDYLGYVEDSGVFIPDLPRSRLGAISFAQLSDDAQGFEGPSDDGEVIPDVDPVLLDRWDADYTISSIWERPVPDELEYDIRASPQLHNLDGADYATDASPASPREEIAAAEHDVSRQPEPLLVRKDGIPGFPTHRQAVRLPADELPIFQGTRISTVSNNENLLQGQSARQSLQEFMRIRSRQVIAPPDVPSQSPVAPAARDTVSDDIPIAVPSELVDRHTLTLPAPRSTPRPVHRYLASLDFIQRRALVRALAAPACAVQLTEREDLDGADLVLDADTAVVFSSLRTLPGRCDVLTARVGRLSWRFAHLLVVFEAFPPGDAPAHALVDGTLAVNPFSPPVIKVVKKLKRDIALAEACYDKRAETSVQLAFPLTLADAAQSVRVFGDLAEERDVTRGALWGERPWLELEDEDLDERDLAAIDGMNAFAAAVVLSSASLDDFLERTPDERLEAFGDLVGRHRIETFNTVIARRRQAMELPSSSPPISSKSPASMEVATTGYQHDAVPGWAE